MIDPDTSDLVAVVIVNWERPEDTIQCIRSVLASNYPNFEIILVDNGSSDDSINRINRTFDKITLITLPNNLGFTGGYNAGIKKALEIGALFIFVLNNDATIDEDVLDLLVNAKWDISVPKITLHDHPNTIWAAGARWRIVPPTIKMIGYKKPDGPEYNLALEIEYATGCALMIKKEVLDKITGFDPLYVNYMEDYDFSFRAREAGYSIGYVPEARVKHKVSQSLGESSPQRWKYLGRNTVLFYRNENRFPRFTAWMVLGWIILRELVQGNAKYLPDFWSGMNEGFEISKGKA
jgi:hypothetical protein